MWAAFKMVITFAGLGIPAGLVLIPWTFLTKKIQPMYRVGKWISAAGIRAAGIKVEQHGRENIPEGAAIFVPNHISNLDPPIMVPLIPGTPSIMLKAELLKIPVLGKAWEMAKFVPVYREGGREAAVRTARYAAEVIRGGLSMLIFAEGTRSKTGRLQAFKAGPFHFAQSTGAPIVPVAIAGTEAMMQKGSSRVYPGVAKVTFLPPVYPADYPNRAEMVAEVRRRIISALPDSMKPLEAE
ncbi:1-acyl-sn-glycerol-3-phosphate acyltransferase [Terriglobus roseus]|uniref:1-acyl-sn-glycerol-3-phosphate acyltransferase n=2 Tax=Terriglobus roseus TaxID=392734 RepID=A0A1G7LYX0_9BACT|nr:1-acyl-sn-glycerol-3-phosphate acyltransferase [Terriglobus roseus]